MNFIGQLLPPLVLGLIIWLVIARRPGSSFPRFRMPSPPPPRPRPRPKRTTPLKLVKGAAMDRELANLLRSEDANRPPPP
jgi:hypothetical protein